MANLCSNYVVVTGDKGAVKALYQQIERQDETFLKNYWILTDTDKHNCDFGLSNLQRNSDTEITFSLCSKWSAPTNELLDVSEIYPTLKFVVLYEEPANAVYGRQVYEGGSCEEDEAYTEEQWLEAHDKDYQLEKKRIQELPYEEFVEEYSKWNDEGEADDEPKYRYLEKDIVKRIKDEDLPLFISVEWLDEDAAQQYKDRYSNVKEAL